MLTLNLGGNYTRTFTNSSKNSR